MTKRDIMTLACRIVAFLIFVDTAANILTSVLLILASFGDTGPSSMRVSGILGLIGQLLVIIVCVLLWLKAEKIAERFIPVSTPERVLLIDENLAPPIIALAGIVIFILGISLVLGAVSYIFMVSQLKNHDLGIGANSRLIAAVFQMAIGIGLFFGAHGISQKLRNRINDKAQA